MKFLRSKEMKVVVAVLAVLAMLLPIIGTFFYVTRVIMYPRKTVGISLPGFGGLLHSGGYQVNGMLKP